MDGRGKGRRFLLKPIDKAPQGGVSSPLLSNLYLNEVDEMMERAREVTRRRGYYNLDYIRSADDMVILVHGHPSEDGLLRTVQRRLKEELDKLQVQMNQEKTKVVNLREGGCFSFLGFDIRLNRNREGKTYVSKTPRMKKRKEIGQKVRAVLRANRDKLLKEVIQAVNAERDLSGRFYLLKNRTVPFSSPLFLY